MLERWNQSKKRKDKMEIPSRNIDTHWAKKTSSSLANSESEMHHNGGERKIVSKTEIHWLT